jgi:hypothetical protein
MSIITRRIKNNTLNVRDFENNIKYLNGDLISETIIDSYVIEDDTVIYKGRLYEVFDEPTKEVILKYNTNNNELSNILGEFGYSFLLEANIAFTTNGIYNSIPIQRRLMSNLDYVEGDKTFNIGGGFNDTVDSIIEQGDGKILVGGQFTGYNGESANYIIRLNSDGSKDQTFDIGGFNNLVYSILFLYQMFGL